MDPRLSKAPLDSEGFVQSFSTTEVDEYLRFFDEYGFVVIRNVLSDDECRATVNEVWTDVEKNTSFEGPVSRNDPSTWGNDRWPQMQKLGIIGTHSCIGKEALKNRQNPKIYDVYRNILKTDKLLVTFDRYGMLRPAKDHPDRKTVRDWIHWDLNPWTFRSASIFFSPITPPQPGQKYKRNILKVQGLVALVDCHVEDGGFHTVPRFSKNCFEEWAKANEGGEHHKKFSENTFVPVPKEETLFSANLQQIPMRAGSMVVWNSKQPHGNYPNDSNQFRICQYIKMISLEHVKDENLHRDFQGDPKYLVPPTFELSELGAKLFGLQEWNPPRKFNYTLLGLVALAVPVIAFLLYKSKML